MAVVEELKLDLEELKSLRGLSIRPRVIALLSSEIAVLDDQLTKAMPASADTVTAPVIPAVSVSQPAASALNYVTIGSFSWDQDIEKIKIYIFLDDLKEEKVDVSFKTMSIDVKFHDVQGKNHRCVIPKLNKEIVPEKCKILVKPAKVIITLCKASKGHWPDLHFKEDKLKPSLDKDKDPMAGIMGLMKNMYDEGDEDMKRTIAKAWTDARSGKTADPSKGFGMEA